MHFIQEWIRSLQYLFYCNVEILIYNQSSFAFLRASSIFQKNNKFVDYNVYKGIELENISVLKKPLTSYSSKQIYLIPYGSGSKNLLTKGEALSKYREILYDKNLLTLLVEEPYLSFFMKFESIKQPGYILQISPYTHLIIPLAVFTSIILFVVVQFVCNKVIIQFSKLEPNFEDFLVNQTTTLEFQNIKNKYEDHCIICYEDYQPNSIVRQLSCDHFFHVACIDRWLISRQHFCPCCRKTVEIVEKTDL
ncbi:hypothetical protein NUSPORA_01804 [Nucleospora cyclopteri]